MYPLEPLLFELGFSRIFIDEIHDGIFRWQLANTTFVVRRYPRVVGVMGLSTGG